MSGNNPNEKICIVLKCKGFADVGVCYIDGNCDKHNNVLELIRSERKEAVTEYAKKLIAMTKSDLPICAMCRRPFDDTDFIY